MEKVSTGTLAFTEAERAAIKKRQRKTEALLLKMADSTPQEADRLAGGFFREIRAMRQIRAARNVPPPPVTAGRARDREHRASETRRTSSSSRTSGTDPGLGDDPDPPRPKHISLILADFLGGLAA